MNIGPFGTTGFGTGALAFTPFYNTKTLIDAVLRNSGHANPANETAKRLVVLNSLSNRYAVITTTQHWEWLYSEVDFLLNAPYSAGTIAIDSGSQVVTGTGTVFDSNAEQLNVLSIPSLSQNYLIDTVDSQTVLNIEGQFAGDDATELSYQIIKPIYRLPPDIEQVQSILIDGFGELVPLGRQEFARLKSHDPCLTGVPRYFTELGKRASDGVGYIEVYPAPEKQYTIRIAYGVTIQSLSDSEDSYPLVPDRHRPVLYYGALADMYRYLRDATMAQDTEGLFMASLLNMRNDTKITDSRISFQPRRNYKQRSTRRRTGRGSISASDYAKED